MFIEDRLEGSVDTGLPVLKQPSTPAISMIISSSYRKGTVDVEDKDFIVSQF